MKTLSGRVAKIALMIVVGSTLVGCAPEQSSTKPDQAPMTARCLVPQDQRESYLPRPGSLPIRLVVDTGFEDAERNAILKAAAEWNQLGQSQAQLNVFEVSMGEIDESVHSGNPRDCSDANERFYPTIPIARETSRTRWKDLGFTDKVTGATIRCQTNKTIDRQVIMLNTTIARPAQLGSITLHELGHALGLNHSCAPKGSDPNENYRSCEGLTKDHPYRAAVMFPTLQIGKEDFIEVKEDLRDNDRERASCLFY